MHQRRMGCRGRDPQYLTYRGRPVLTTNILTSVLFFSLQRNFWIPQVAVIFICNASSVQFWHVRMHHITPFWDEKFINFLGRGTAPPQTPPPRHLRRLEFSRLWHSTCDPPNVLVALTPMRMGDRDITTRVKTAVSPKLQTSLLCVKIRCWMHSSASHFIGIYTQQQHA